MRRVLSVLLWLGGGYAALCALVYAAQDRLIFYPHKNVRPVPPSAEPVALDRDDVTLHGWLVNGSTPGPVVIYFGGNGEELSGLVPTVAALKATTVLVNYRGYGESEGAPSQDALVADGKAVYDWVRSRFAERPIIVAGRSIGTGVAQLTVAERPADGVVLVSPFRSVRHLAERIYPWLPVRWLLRHPFDTTPAHASLPEDNTLVLYATDDTIIPPRETEAYLAALDTRRPPLRPQVVTFRGNHNVPLESPSIWRALTRFLERFQN